MTVNCYQPQFSAEAPPVEEVASEPELDAGLDAAEGLDADQGPVRELFFQVTTRPVGGRFMPYNVGAIWIEGADARFVRTLALWGVTRARYLRRFQAASGGDALDAVTGPTLATHETHELGLELRDLMRQAMPDGDYQLLVELTDRNGLGASLELPFVLGDEAFEVTPEDTAQFRDMRLTVTTPE